ncbi:MAG: triose-phosphate isomerase [Oscillospiraceae bacterium]|nr:triose-phosphate isomerase [Oscillospiraceae bacterium]
MRRKVIAGNWKMNLTPAEAKVLVGDLAGKIAGNPACDVVVCVPFVDIATVVEATAGTCIKVGAQNMHQAEKGAFTGEISAPMLVACGVEYVVIGHSERRQYFSETDETVNAKVKSALAAGLKVILCVGETLAERETGVTEETVSRQVKLGLVGVTEAQLANVIIAYEPVWAIGTGVTASDEQAEETCAFTRGVIAEVYSAAAADAIVIQYGGSMNAANAAGLLSMGNIDGGLVGGASLKADDFATIVTAAG